MCFKRQNQTGLLLIRVPDLASDGKNQAVAHQMEFHLAAVTADTKQIQMALTHRRRLANACGRPLRLDAGQHLFSPPEIAIGRHQQATQGVVSAAHVIELDPGTEASMSLG